MNYPFLDISIFEGNLHLDFQDRTRTTLFEVNVPFNLLEDIGGVGRLIREIQGLDK